MEKVKIRKELNDIISINEEVINSLKGQKARQEQMIEKYEEEVMEEVEIPSNKFQRWARSISIYRDSIISGKLLDFEIQKKFEQFLKDVISYETDYILSENMVKNLEFGVDMCTETVLKLEKRMVDLKTQHQKDILNLQKRIIRHYQNLPDEEKHGKGFCKYCGKKINPDQDQESICIVCDQIPLQERPFLRKKGEDQPHENIENQEVEETPNEPEMQEESVNTEIPDDKKEEEISDEELLDEDEKEETKSPAEIKKKKQDFQNIMDRFENKYEKDDEAP